MKIQKRKEERYWRIRMKDGNENLSKCAWDSNEVGIWYGAWTIEDWSESLKSRDQFKYLKKLPQPKGREKLRKIDIDTAQRFAGITKDDWVVVFFDDSLHLARVDGGLKSIPNHSMNRNGEIFKYRKIIEKKSFQLKDLPDSYRLISSAGRGNVHEFSEARRTLIEFLAKNKNEESVVKAINAEPFMQWLDLLGPAGWESFCLGYLILMEEFLPTGLGIGRTLPMFDIVGHNKRGDRIFAQCKKNPSPVPLPVEFIDACKNMKKGTCSYFFAYGGVTGNHKMVEVVDREDMQRWVVHTDVGKKYAAMWR